MRYSRQRELITDIIKGRCDHPTADMIYNSAREIEPNISLGTVYRNLSELCEDGRLVRVSVEGSAERFDAYCAPHVHHVCKTCGAVTDLPMDKISINHDFQGVDHYQVTFYGTCEGCRNKA